MPAVTTDKPANVAVIDAVLRNSENKKTNSVIKQTNSVVGNYQPKYTKRRKGYYSPASHVYLKYKRYSPPDDFIIVENNPTHTTTGRPVQVIDLVKNKNLPILKQSFLVQLSTTFFARDSNIFLLIYTELLSSFDQTLRNKLFAPYGMSFTNYIL